MDNQRQIRRMIQRIGRVETKAAGLNYSGVTTPPFNTYTVTYLGQATAGVTTYSIQDGYYVRLGRLIAFNGRVTWTNATGTGTALISLPFTAGTAPSGTFRWSGSVWTNNVTIGTFSPQMRIDQGGTAFIMGQPANNAANVAIAVEVAGDIMFSGWYLV